MTTLVIMIALFIGLSGLMAAVDAAVMSVTRPEIEELVQHQCRGAIQLRDVKRRMNYSVVVIVIVTNTINILGPVLISHQAFRTFHSRGVLVVMIVLTLCTIVFSEILPKALGTRFTPYIARLSAPAIVVGAKLMFPLVVSLAWLTELLTPGSRRIGTEPQIRSLVRIGHQAGHIESHEEQMIHRTFVLNDRNAGNIMTPIADVRAISASKSILDASEELIHSEFSRYPVFGSTIDDIKGILISRDLLKAVVAGDTERSLLSLVKKPLTVGIDDRSDDLLALFRDQRLHLAVVKSEERTVGVVTLEDVLEELVGEIDDEKDAS